MTRNFNVVFCHGPSRTYSSYHEICAQNVFDFICPNSNAVQPLNSSDFYIICNGRKVDNTNVLEENKTYHIVPKLVGGKGGFGSMLRAIGAQIEKTTSREACRDLSGRRMRDINNEKKLKEWMSKEAEREKEKEDRRQERLARRLNQGQHKFDDPQYFEQRAKVQEDLEDALKTGLKRAHKKDEIHTTSSSKKTRTSGQLNKEWLGLEFDSDELDSGSDTEASPGKADGLMDHDGAASTSKCSAAELTTRQDHRCSDSDQTDRSSEAESQIQDGDSSLGHSPSSKKCSLSQAEVKQDGDEGDNKANVSLLSLLPPPADNTCSQDIKQKPVPAEEIDPTTPVDLDLYNSQEDLAVLGLERLKCALMIRGLKCGGTLEERAGRLFAVQGLKPDEIDPSLLAKSKGKGKKSK